MQKQSFLLILLGLTSYAAANETFLTPPTEYVISGSDRYGESAYQMHAVVGYNEKQTTLRELSVRIYDASITIAADLLEKVRDPDLGRIRVINDAGIVGSYFYIDIPFGDVPRCRAARKKKLKMTLHISSVGTMDGEGLRAYIHDPCDKS